MKIYVSPEVKKNQISRNIYGNFSEHLGRCIYGGVYVGEDSEIPNIEGMRTDIIEALKQIRLPVLRWPGGCFADDYHWMDGIGPKADRPTMVNTNWGGVTEDNSFGTHEFLRFCELVGAEPYINGNVGSGTVREMKEWIEYMTFDGISPMADLRRKNGHEEPWKLKYFGLGNEAWGCGGMMRPEYYADEYRRYNTYLRDYSGNQLFRIASGASGDDYHWTKVLMERIGGLMHGLTLHHYSIAGDSWENKGPALGFDERLWFGSMASSWRMDEIVSGHDAVMSQYDPDKKIALIVDEWGNWFNVEEGTNPGFLYQQNSLRDACVAGMILNIFNQHSDRVKMANLAQLINVLQSVILTEGAQMILTPTYHVMDLYKDHQDAWLIASAAVNVPDYTYGDHGIPAVTQTVSQGHDGSLTVTLANVDPNHGQNVDVIFADSNITAVSGRVLTADSMDAHNSFEEPDVVHPDAYVPDYEDGTLHVCMPSKSVMSLKVNL